MAMNTKTMVAALVVAALCAGAAVCPLALYADNSDNGMMPFGAPGMDGNGIAPGEQNNNVEYASESGEIKEGSTTNSAQSLTADTENAKTITITDENNDITIKEAGTYIITGSSSDGNITVKKGTTGVVLILEDLDLTSTTGATLSLNKESEVQVVISGNVTLTDDENPDDEDSADEKVADAYDGAAIKAKADSTVYITGDGTLTINGNAKNGIKSGDDTSIIIDTSTLNITATNDGINGNYDVTILSGDVTISAGDDAIHADHILTIGSEESNGPTIDIKKSYEGLEATVVNLISGSGIINSSDDAVNAANSDDTYSNELGYSVNVLGGNWRITSSGDGIDSNGNVNIVDGTVSIKSASNGGEAGIDYDGQLYVSDSATINNQSGISGPDMMPGMGGFGMGPNGQNNSGFPGQQNGQNGMQNQNNLGMNDQNGIQQPQMRGQDNQFNGQNGMQMNDSPKFGQNNGQMQMDVPNNGMKMQNGMNGQPEMGGFQQQPQQSGMNLNFDQQNIFGPEASMPEMQQPQMGGQQNDPMSFNGPQNDMFGSDDQNDMGFAPEMSVPQNGFGFPGEQMSQIGFGNQNGIPGSDMGFMMNQGFGQNQVGGHDRFGMGFGQQGMFGSDDGFQMMPIQGAF